MAVTLIDWIFFVISRCVCLVLFELAWNTMTYTFRVSIAEVKRQILDFPFSCCVYAHWEGGE